MQCLDYIENKKKKCLLICLSCLLMYVVLCIYLFDCLSMYVVLCIYLSDCLPTYVVLCIYLFDCLSVYVVLCIHLSDLFAHVHCLVYSFVWLFAHVRCLVSLPDKSPQMNEFLAHIKATPELAAMYDTIQKDAVTTGQEIISMDTS